MSTTSLALPCDRARSIIDKVADVFTATTGDRERLNGNLNQSCAYAAQIAPYAGDLHG
jgi:hypothetical protein